MRVTLSDLVIGLCWLLLLLVLIRFWRGTGILAWVGLTAAVLTVGHVMYRYSVEPIVELDSVPCARCGHVGDYDVEVRGRDRIWRCTCGAEYSFAGPTLRIDEGASGPRPYMRWKWWGQGRWRPIAPQDCA